MRWTVSTVTSQGVLGIQATGMAGTVTPTLTPSSAGPQTLLETHGATCSQAPSDPGLQVETKEPDLG